MLLLVMAWDPLLTQLQIRQRITLCLLTVLVLVFDVFAISHYKLAFAQQLVLTQLSR